MPDFRGVLVQPAERKPVIQVQRQDHFLVCPGSSVHMAMLNVDTNIQNCRLPDDCCGFGTEYVLRKLMKVFCSIVFGFVGGAGALEEAVPGILYVRV